MCLKAEPTPLPNPCGMFALQLPWVSIQQMMPWMIHDPSKLQGAPGQEETPLRRSACVKGRQKEEINRGRFLQTLSIRALQASESVSKSLQCCSAQRSVVLRWWHRFIFDCFVKGSGSVQVEVHQNTASKVLTQEVC